MEREELITPEVEKMQAGTRYLLDMMGGDDGGVAFLNYREGLKNIASQADKGDANAKQICRIVTQYIKLARYLGGGGK